MVSVLIPSLKAHNVIRIFNTVQSTRTVYRLYCYTEMFIGDMKLPMLIKHAQVLLPPPGTRNQARKWTPQLKLISASTHLHEVHHSYPHLLLHDKQEGKYRHTAPEKTGITYVLQRVDKGVGKDTWNIGT